MQEQLGIAGSGAIATGLAVNAAAAGGVVMWARSDASADRARARVAKIASKLEGVDPANVRVETDLAALGDASFLVEAIVEDTASKAELLAQLGAVAGPDAILATTTSSLSIDELAEASGRRDRFAGLHVFNPVPKMKLVELAFPEEATAQTRERTLALCHALGKEPVEVPDIPGFVVNQLLFPYLFSAVRFMEDNDMEPAAVDTCMQLGAGHPIGPIALLDYVGLDVSAAIGDAIGSEVPQRVRDLVAEGALGRKTGHGLYPPEEE